MKSLIIILSVFVLSSCASMSENECMTKNWYKQGIKDAKAGVAKSKYSHYKETCLRFDISFDREEYVQGYESVKESSEATNPQN